MDIDIKLKFLSFRKRILIGRQWVKSGIILGVAILSTIAAYWGSQYTLMLLLLLVGGTAFVLALLKEPNLGFILIFLGGMFIPFVGPGGINAAAAMVAFMLGLWVFDVIARKRDMQFIDSAVILPVVVFLVITVLAFGMGQIPWFVFANQAPLTAQAGGFVIFILSAASLLLSAHVIREERWLQIIVWSFIGLSAIYVLGRALRISQIDRVYQLGFTAGSMFWTWMVALVSGQVLYNSLLKKRVRILLILLVVITLYVAVVQSYDWKSGWLPPLVSLAVLLGLRFKRLTLLAIPFGLFFISIAISTLISSDEYSWGTRVDAWAIVLKISQVNPLLGLGFSNYYWYTPLFPIRGWVVSFNSHSQYVDLIAQVGILGLLCFFWIFYEVGRLGWRLSRRLPEGFAQSYTYSVVAGVAGTLVAGFLVDWILPFVYNIGFTGFRASILPWLFCGALLSIEQIYFGKPTG